MPGRFALFTDENVDGPLIKALSARGWDMVRAVDVFGERTEDEACSPMRRRTAASSSPGTGQPRPSRSGSCVRVEASAA